MDLFILPTHSRTAPLLEIEFAGCTAPEHLRTDAAACFAVRALGDAAAASAPALYVRPEAWFGVQSFANLATRLAAGMPAGGLVISVGDEPLAACLSADRVGTIMANGLQNPREVLHLLSAKLPQQLRLDAAELRPDFPPGCIRSLLDVARIEKRILLERAHALLLRGVRIRDPERIAIRGELVCGDGVDIDLDVIVEGQVRLADRVRVGPNCILKNAIIGQDSRVNAFSIVEDASVGDGSFVGPFARVRPGTGLGDRAQIGSFVEIKNAQIGYGARINHLAFVGDALLGNEVTLGAGVITCNHDGKTVHTTQIGDRAYVGSGSELIAPVSIGADAFIAAGSTITRDAPPGKLTLARARQVSVDRRSPEEPGTGAG